MYGQIGYEANFRMVPIMIKNPRTVKNRLTEASFVFASDRSLKVCYDRSLANTKLASGQTVKIF